MLPGTSVVPCLRVKVVVLMVEGSIASLKVPAIWLPMATPVARLAGTAALTVGAVVSDMTPVVKLQTKSAVIGLPARSLAPAVRVAEYTVLGPSSAAGVKVAVLLAAS